MSPRARTSREVARILFVDHVARLSGGELALVRLVEALGDSVEAHVALGEAGPLVARLEAAGATVHVLEMSSGLRELRRDRVARAGRGGIGVATVAATMRYVLQLRRLIRTLAPDLVHTNSLKAALCGGLAARLAGVPVLWHVRDRIAPDYLPGPAVALVRGLSRVLPSAVIANSASTLATLPGARQGCVVASAVVFDGVRVRPGGCPRSGETSPPGPFRVGVVGRPAPWKGQHVFLAAFAAAFAPTGEPVERQPGQPGQPVQPVRAVDPMQAVQAVQAVQGVLVGAPLFGEHDYAAQLRRQAAQLRLVDRVEFRGFRDDVETELGRLDVLVHCSVVPEPFGQVVVEAMAAGVPVVAAAAGGPAEVIEDDVDGLLVEPGDVVALAAALRRLHADPALRARLAAAGRVTATRFDTAGTVRGVWQVYERVLTLQPSRRKWP